MPISPLAQTPPGVHGLGDGAVHQTLEAVNPACGDVEYRLTATGPGAIHERLGSAPGDVGLADAEVQGRQARGITPARGGERVLDAPL